MTVSLIVYGRNDQIGYNAHKRVAMSLNAMAEVLTHPNDEILFTDYNTENSQPTQLEALQDTLTEKAKNLIKIFRVRAEVHSRFAGRTHLQVNEPLARNVAIRRSNPNNKWILSTNTDMIFVPQNKSYSLSDIIANIKEDYYYAISRFEVPETLWESLNRLDPLNVIESINQFGKQFHLNEISLSHKYIYYDAPGDFQLAPRQHYFDLYGFHEDMILGWHVDSNFSRRYALRYGLPKSLQEKVYGYHTSHTKIVGSVHSPKKVSQGNDCYLYCEAVSSPYIEEQKDTWGLANEEIEEIRLSDSNNHIMLFTQQLEKIFKQPQKECLVVDLLHENAGKLTKLDIFHTLPYLLEQIAHQKHGAHILYIGVNHKLLSKLIEFTNVNNKNFKVYFLELFNLTSDYADESSKNLLTQASKLDIDFNIKENKNNTKQITDILDYIKHQNIDCVIFDCSIDSEYFEQVYLNYQINKIVEKWRLIFEDFLESLTAPVNNLLKLKVICVGAHCNIFGYACNQYLNCTSSPFTTRVIHGYPISHKPQEILTSRTRIRLRKIKQLLKSIVRHIKDIAKA